MNILRSIVSSHYRSHILARDCKVWIGLETVNQYCFLRLAINLVIYYAFVFLNVHLLAVHVLIDCLIVRLVYWRLEIISRML